MCIYIKHYVTQYYQSIKEWIEEDGLNHTDCFSLDFPTPCDPHPVMTLIIWTAEADIKSQSDRVIPRKCESLDP